MNFDDDDDSDFNITSPQSGNKLASLFKSNVDPSGSSETLKYKAPKQPQATAPQTSTATAGQATSSILFSSTVQAFKYANNKYENQGKLGLAILSNVANGQVLHRLLLYTTTKQTAAAVRLTVEFKISVQKSNYVSFYDEQKQLWSIMFDNEDAVVNFASQLSLCKCNLLQGNIDGYRLHQELKVTDVESAAVVEPTDSIEAVNITSLVKDQKLNEIENNSQKPFRFKLGKNKLPQAIEELLIGMKQGDRKLIVLNGNLLKSVYPSAAGLVVFYDISVLRIKKASAKEEAPVSVEQMPPLPQLGHIETSAEARSRSESVKDKTKMISEQINDPKTEKAKLISRMAKMGQQMLPSGAQSGAGHDVEEDWSSNSAATSLQHEAKAPSMPGTSGDEANFMQQQQMQEAIANQKAALFLQNQQLQQQLALQTQQLNQAVAAAQAQAAAAATSNIQPIQNTGIPNQIQGGQLALYKSPYMMTSQMYTQPMETTFVQQQQQQQQPAPSTTPQQQPHQSSELITIQSKLEQILDKLESVRSAQQSNLPNMETSVILHNIQRLVKENEQYKKDLYDKGAKIEEQNAKITELLSKQQSYVEQSHQILESKNSTFQVSSEKAQLRVLELEKEKLALTQELTESTARISELNLEINRMRKDDLEMRQQLSEVEFVSKNTDQYKQSVERLTLENADLQSKLDAQIAEVKKEKLARKTIESKLQLSEDEVSEVRSSMASMQKLMDERKRKSDAERAQFDAELDELKKAHETELLVLKDKLTRLKADTSEAQLERVKQIEQDLVAEWTSKMQQALDQADQKYERKVSALETELSNLRKQADESSSSSKTLRLEMNAKQAEYEKLKQQNDDLHVIREKYERLQAQALVMKERYETRIKELLDAEPDAEVIGEEIKKLMNLMYKRLKVQIKADQFYSGNGILTAMLKMIKMITLQVISKNESEETEEDVDYFSQHIYQAPPPPPAAPVVSTSTMHSQTSVDESLKQEVKAPIQLVEESAAAPTSTSLVAENASFSSSSTIDKSPKQGFDEVDEKEQEKQEENSQTIDEIRKELDMEEDNKESVIKEETASSWTNESLTEDPTQAISESSSAVNLVESGIKEAQETTTTTNDSVKPDDAAVDTNTNETETETETEIAAAQESNDSEYDLMEDVNGSRNGTNRNDEETQFISEASPSPPEVQKEEEGEEKPAQVVEEEEKKEEEKLEETVSEEKQPEEETKDSEVKEEIKQNTEEKPTEEEKVEEKEEEKKEETIETKYPEVKKPPSKGLFDDDDDDDDNNELFSFSSNKPSSTVKKEEKQQDATQQATNKVSASALTSLSPPPLFEGDDDDKDIDWFK